MQRSGTDLLVEFDLIFSDLEGLGACNVNAVLPTALSNSVLDADDKTFAVQIARQTNFPPESVLRVRDRQPYLTKASTHRLKIHRDVQIEVCTRKNVRLRGLDSNQQPLR